MSRTSRRKTLSHSEIESFLTEISVVKNDENASNSSASQDKTTNFLKSNCPNNGLDYVSDERQWIRDLCKVLCEFFSFGQSFVYIVISCCFYTDKV